MKLLLKVIFLFVCANVFARQYIQVVPKHMTKQTQDVKIDIQDPLENEIWIKLKLKGHQLGEMTKSKRTAQIANFKGGQSVHVIIDNHPYVIRSEAEAVDDEALFKFKLPFELSQGKHYLRVFPAWSYGESLKGKNCFAASSFFIQNKRDNYHMDLSKPYVTFNEPSGYIRFRHKEPVLLDFLVANCHLSQNGYKVRVSVDNKNVHILTRWVPYYIYGLEKGNHIVKLELIDKKFRSVPGLFNSTSRSISVY